MSELEFRELIPGTDFEPRLAQVVTGEVDRLRVGPDEYLRYLRRYRREDIAPEFLDWLVGQLAEERTGGGHPTGRRLPITADRIAYEFGDPSTAKFDGAVIGIENPRALLETCLRAIYRAVTDCRLFWEDSSLNSASGAEPVSKAYLSLRMPSEIGQNGLLHISDPRLSGLTIEECLPERIDPQDGVLQDLTVKRAKATAIPRTDLISMVLFKRNAKVIQFLTIYAGPLNPAYPKKSHLPARQQALRQWWDEHVEVYI